MNTKFVEWKKREFLAIILLLHMFVYFFVFFNIPIVRQIIGFIYLSFVLGLIIIKLLRLNELKLLETFLFSAGFSIAFLMFLGVFINEFGFLMGFSRPLSLILLTTVLNSLIIILVVFAYLRDNSFSYWDTFKFPLHNLLLISLPIFSVIGAMLVNIYENNSLLIVMIISIAFVFTLGAYFRKLSFSKFYPLAVFAIAISLLWHSSLISKYFVTFGSDVSYEYFVFKTTESNAHWSSINPFIGGEWLGFGRLNAMLSVTILPTVYAHFLNLESMWIFKMLYPLIFSLVPLGLYQLWQQYLGNKYAFISAFLFMAEATFYNEMHGLNRQMIAELFFVLLLLVITNKKMTSARKMICFMVFSFGLATSHYGLAEIFLFFISAVLTFLFILRRSSRNITVGMVIFFFVIMFSWYIFTSRSAVFESFLEYGRYVYQQLSDFFNPESRGKIVLLGLGLEPPPTIWNMLSRFFAYLTEAFIVAGFIGLIMKRVKVKFDKEYLTFILVAMAFLLMLILVPGLAKTMNITRFYHILLFFLAPLCVLGAETVVTMIRKWNIEVKVSILLLIVLVPYFLFQTGFIYEVTKNDSWSVSLSKYRMSALRLFQLGYTNAYDVFGPKWLSSNVAVENNPIYCDPFSWDNLRGYGLVYPGYTRSFSKVVPVEGGVVYLSSLSVIHGDYVALYTSWNISELQFLHDLSKIYTNGGSEIYYKND